MTRFVFIATFCLAVLTGNESRSEPLAPPILEGSVQQRLVLDKALLESFSPFTVDVTFETDKGRTGVDTSKAAGCELAKTTSDPVLTSCTTDAASRWRLRMKCVTNAPADSQTTSRAMALSQ